MPGVNTHIRVLGVIACVSLALAAMAIFAMSADAGSVVVSPSKIELKLESGAEDRFEVAVSNTSTTPMSAQVKAWDFARDEAGSIRPIDAVDAARFHGCSAWVTLPSPNPMVIEPDSTSTLKFAVRVPQDVADGSRYCYLEFRSTAATLPEELAKSSSRIRVPVVYSMNALLLVQVGKPSASGAPAYKQGISVKPLLVKSLNFKPQVVISAPIRNEGTVHSNLVQGSGFQIWQGGTLKASIPLQEYTLLPESTIAVPAVWSTNAVFGKFTVRFIGAIGAERPIVAERTFWVLKPWFLAAVVAAILLIVTLSIIFFRRFRIQLAPRSGGDS